MKISVEVKDVLVKSTCEGNKMILPDIQLDRSLYVAVNQALTNLGGKWNRAAKAHLFKGDCEDVIEQLIFTGEYTDKKKEFQFFETPANVAERLWEILDPPFGSTILEPSAGTGAILDVFPRFKDCELNSIELMEENHVELCRKGYECMNMDFLDHEGSRYGYIIMNPPFSKMQDIAHVTHAIGMANKRVVAVMSPSWTFRTGKKVEAFIELLAQHEYSWDNLPEGSFKSSGTNVNTGILTVNIRG